MLKKHNCLNDCGRCDYNNKTAAHRIERQNQLNNHIDDIFDGRIFHKKWQIRRKRCDENMLMVAHINWHRSNNSVSHKHRNHYSDRNFQQFFYVFDTQLFVSHRIGVGGIEVCTAKCSNCTVHETMRAYRFPIHEHILRELKRKFCVNVNSLFNSKKKQITSRTPTTAPIR